jgi:hypothetical protein
MNAGPTLAKTAWTHQFTIELGAPGFTQYLRRPPVYTSGHRLTVEERGGFSFDRQAYTL